MKKLLSIFTCVLLPSIALGFTEPPILDVVFPTGGIPKYVDADCANGLTTYDPTTESCTEGSSTVYSTIENADGNVGAGNYLYLMDTAYNVQIDWAESGTAGNEIVIRPGPGKTVTVNYNGTGNRNISINGSYVILDGFAGGTTRRLIFDGETETPYGGSFYLIELITGSHVTLYGIIGRNSDAEHSSCGTIDLSGPGNDYARIYNCLLENSTAVGCYMTSGDYVEFRNNIVRNNGGQGIQVNPHTSYQVMDEVTISGNIVVNNGYTYPDGRGGITLEGAYLNSVETVYCYNNLVANNFVDGIAVWGNMCENYDIYVYNNTSYGNGTNGIEISNDGNHGTISLQNNISYGNGTNWYAVNSIKYGITGTNCVNNLVTDPSFASTTESDSDFLWLSASSTNAIGQGSVLTAMLTNDLYGTTRGSSWDIGAVEYEASGLVTYYLDSDGDGWPEGTTQQAESDPGATWYELSELTGTTTDCNDSDAAINPGATEICGNGVDEDCDGTAQACPVSANVKGVYSSGCIMR